MKKSLKLVFLLLSLHGSVSYAKWSEIGNDDPSVTCNRKAGVGKTTCCDCKTCSGPWELPCQGDLSSTCTADQLVGPGGQGDGFNYTQVITGSCGGTSCQNSHWNYTWSCCDPPVVGNWESYHGNSINPYCPMGAFFVGCTLPNEILTPDGSDCVNTTCPSLTTVSSTSLVGNQAVVNATFVSALNSLIKCATSLGGSAKLSMINSSQCSKSTSTGENATSSITAHQVGMAVDVSLVLPDGTACTRNCMAQGYCAFHQSSKACANSTNCPACQGQPENQQNTYVNKFFTCAQSIKGLKLGSSFSTANWNHFEMAVAPNVTSALKAYAPQLKAFCMGLCPGKTKKTTASNMCSCAGF